MGKITAREGIELLLLLLIYFYSFDINNIKDFFNHDRLKKLLA